MNKTGKVITHFTKDDQKYTVLERSKDNLSANPEKSRHFVIRHDGSKQSNKGENQTFMGVEETANKYTNSKGEVMETYFQPTTSTKGTTSYVKSEKTSDGAEVRTEVTEKIPEVISKSDIVALEPYFNLMRMGMDVAIAAGLLQGVTDEMERDNIVSTCAFGILREAKKIKETFEKHNK